MITVFRRSSRSQRLSEMKYDSADDLYKSFNNVLVDYQGTPYMCFADGLELFLKEVRGGVVFPAVKHKIDATKGFVFRPFKMGYAPTLYGLFPVYISQIPARQWRFGVNRNNTCMVQVAVAIKSGNLRENNVNVRDDAFLWMTAAVTDQYWQKYPTLRKAHMNAMANYPLSPEFAVCNKWLIHEKTVVGKVVDATTININEVFYSTVLVNKLRDLGADYIHMKVENEL